MMSKEKRAFFDRIALDWDKEHRLGKEEGRVERLFRSLHLKKGDRVLDAGCGTGRLVPHIRKKIGEGGIIVEADFSAAMLEIAKKNYIQDNLYFLQSEADRIPLGQGLFDAVICFALFPHIQNKLRALQEFQRVLKPGRSLFIVHTMRRLDLNRLHARVKGPVSRDYLPDKREMENLFSFAELHGLSIREDSSSYIAEAKA